MTGEPCFRLAGRRVWVAGHRGLVGSALTRRLAREDVELVTADRAALDLRDQAATLRWLDDVRPELVFIAAATVGGIVANDSRPAEFLYDNLAIATNILHGSWKAGVAKLVYLGSSCIYPKFADQPIAEDALLTGLLEPTNEAYAVAKIAGIKLAQAYRRQYGCDYIAAMPTNLYGTHDNYDLTGGHVLPALIRKAHEAKERGDAELVIWGTGTPRREFLHSDDCADALLFLATRYSGDGHVNVGSGRDLTILELARLVADVVGFRGRIAHDLSKPDGTPRKLMSGERLAAMGWAPRVDLRDGIADAYAWFRSHVAVPA